MIKFSATFQFLPFLLFLLFPVFIYHQSFAQAQVVPYTSDGNTVLLDHFNGSTQASIVAYSENGAACGSAKPSATPVWAYVSGPNGLSQALSLSPPVGQPASSATYLQFPGGQLLSQSSGTLEFWVYFASYGSGLGLADQGPYYGSCAGWTLGFAINSTGQLLASAWNAFDMNSGTNLVPLNAWTHVAATWGGSGGKLYINGVLAGSSTNTGMPAPGFGGSVMMKLGTGGGVTGMIDELRISNIQRTSFNILQVTNRVVFGVDMSKQRAIGAFQTGDTVMVRTFSGVVYNKILSNVAGTDVYRDTVNFGSYTGSFEYKFWKSRGVSDTNRYEIKVGSGSTYGNRVDTVATGTKSLSTVMFNNDSTLAITSFTPTSGSVGTSVTLNGYRFSSVATSNSVWFGSTRASVTSASTTTLAVTVPSGAMSGPISVTDTVLHTVDYSVQPFILTFPSDKVVAANSFASKVDFPSGTAPLALNVKDIDGDGKPDILMTDNVNAVMVFRNTSTAGSITSGSFAAKVSFTTGGTPYDFATGDLDGDGKPDLVVGNDGAGSVSVFRNTAVAGSITTGSFSARTDFTVATNPRGIALADIDGDGKLDILVANANNNTISILRNTSTGGKLDNSSFDVKVDFTVGSYPSGIATADIDGDGMQDVIVANSNSNTISLLRNSGLGGGVNSGSLAAKVDFATGVSPLSVLATDFDGDGKIDIIVSDYLGSSLSMFRNTSTIGVINSGSLATRFGASVNQNPYHLATGDIDGDGKADLVVTSSYYNVATVFRNVSSSGGSASTWFATGVNFAAGSSPYWVEVCDIDGGGKPDLCVGNYSGYTFSVLRNTVSLTNVVSFGVDMGKQRALGTFQTGDTVMVKIFTGMVENKVLTNVAGTDEYRDTVNFGAYTGPYQYKFWKSRGTGDADRYEGNVGTGVNGNRIDTSLGWAERLATAFFNNDSTLVITSFSPDSVVAGTLVYISGYGFSTTLANNTVTFGGIATDVLSASKTVLSVNVPGGISGQVSISVSVGSATVYAPKAFTVLLSPPSAPTNLSATAVSSTQINLTWTASTGSPTRYRIYRSLTSGSGFSKVDSVSGSTTTYSNTGLSASTTYYYLVYAVNAGGQSAASNQVNATTTTAVVVPSAPTGLTAVAASSSQIDLSWTASATGSPTLYRVFRSLTSGTGFSKIDSVTGTTTTYSNTGLNAGTTYYYLVYAVNAGGQSAASNQASATTGTLTPPGIPTLISPSNGASGMSTKVTFTWAAGSGTTPTSYRLQVSVSSTFSPLAVDDSTITTTDASVSSLAHGTPYYWKVRAQHQNGNSNYTSSRIFTTSSTATHAPSSPISFPANPSSSTHYKMVSFPGNINGLSVGQLMSGNSPDDWILFQDNGATTNYFQQLSSGSSLLTGRGYWLVRRGDYTPSYSTAMPSLSADGTFSISLQQGWNIIGNPFNVSVRWSAVQAANAISSIPIYSYSGTTSFAASSTLEPFVGYYFDNRTANKMMLKIPYPFPASGAAPEPVVPFAWKIQLIFGSDINEDRENYVGISPSADDNFDAIDTRKPPLFKDLGFLYFSRPAWDGEYDKFNGDFRRELGEGQVWEFDVSHPRRSPGTVRIAGVETVPADYRLVLINTDNTSPVDVRQENEYTFNPVREKTKFKLIVGRDSFVQAEVNKYIPTKIALHQNFPNPFNPSTTVGFELPRDASVRLVVTNILGQEVKTLAEGYWGAGIHRVAWNGDDEAGRRVATGVYFYRLSMGNDVVGTKKMLLTK